MRTEARDADRGWTVRTRRLERGGWAGEVEFGKARRGGMYI